MKFGVCRGLDDFEAMKSAKAVGIDFWECGFGSLAEFDDEKIRICQEMLNEHGLSCYAANGFLPGNLKVVGGSVDYNAIADYLDRGFERAGLFGVKTIVFGSGAARSFEDGFSPEKAEEQLIYFLDEYALPRAKKIGAGIVMEPLRFGESKMIHMVADGVQIAEKCKYNNIYGLADLYHVYGNDDKIDNLNSMKGKVKHSHIANPVTRCYPCNKDSDEIIEFYKDFLKTLYVNGCSYCSVEARTDDFAADIASAISLLRDLTKNF